ncbi:winged helix-turn-helix domain-containing protein [Natranaeroarchaeum sulfidigenes]|uniref:HTH deoR-type domain-containing protein n=1 Tax=Natranaeroarchaeum sulfidigenes TaxID=2784880 RepID=A0A897MPZ8_9EURY|nr:winged helix-turn-helix domain-containing protein [Natranaeroarchaeum sulfidigenes]QSG02502.1 hypothetical protein AArcS_1285 [Natranaeroarchaeum sulfidigenes]
MSPLCDQIRQAARQSEILQTLEDVDATMTATEIADRVDGSTSTVRDDLRRLDSAGLVTRKDPRQPYRWTTSPRAPEEISPEAVIQHV